MPATSSTPPITSDQLSKDPTTLPPCGRPAAIHAWQSVKQAATRRARLARTQAIRRGCRKPLRCEGRSTFASSRMRTRRRAISFENSGLLPVAIQVHRIGNRAISDTPRMRSSQNGAVSTAARAGQSSLRLRLSISTIVRHLAQLRGDPLAPLVLVAPLGHDAGASAGQERRDRVDHQRRPGAGRRLLDEVQGRRAVDQVAHEVEQEQRHRMGTLGRANEREVAEELVAEEPARSRNLRRRRLRRDRRQREAGGRHIEQLGVGVVAGLGHQVSVPAEDRGVDDRPQHRQVGIGGRQHRTDEVQGGLRRNDLAPLQLATPVAKACQQLPQTVLGHFNGDRPTLVVADHPGGDPGMAEEPRSTVGCAEQLPGPVDGASQVALVGAHDRPVVGLPEVQRPVPAALEIGVEFTREGSTILFMRLCTPIGVHSGEVSRVAATPRGGRHGNIRADQGDQSAPAQVDLSRSAARSTLLQSQTANFCSSSGLKARRMANRYALRSARRGPVDPVPGLVAQCPERRQRRTLARLPPGVFGGDAGLAVGQRIEDREEDERARPAPAARAAQEVDDRLDELLRRLRAGRPRRDATASAHALRGAPERRPDPGGRGAASRKAARG